MEFCCHAVKQFYAYLLTVSHKAKLSAETYALSITALYHWLKTPDGAAGGFSINDMIPVQELSRFLLWRKTAGLDRRHPADKRWSVFFCCGERQRGSRMGAPLGES